MKKTPASPAEPHRLRQQAEGRLRAQPSPDRALTAAEARVLLHELQVHQIELEMQNEELQRAQLEAQQAAEKYIELFDFAPVGAFVLDEQGVVREVNLAGAALLGHDRARVAGQPFAQYLVPEARAAFHEFCHGGAANDGRRACETQLLKHGHDPCDVHVDLVPVQDAAGQRCGCRLAVSDVSERIRLEAQLRQLNAELEQRVATRTAELQCANDALRASERRYSALFANKINGMTHCRMIVDEHGRPVDYVILQINAACERILGIKKADIEGRRVTEVFPEIANYRVDYIGVLGRVALASDEITLEEFFEATGQYLSIYAYSPAPGEFIAIFTDVTARKQAEAALRVSEERLQFALESCQIGAWDLDLVNHTAYRSLEHARIFGYTEPLPQWTLGDFLRHTLPEYRTEVETMVREATAAQRGWTYECQIRRADGEVRWIWLTGQYRTDSSGRSRVAGVVQDITARKQAEAQIKAALAEKEVLLKEIHHRVKNNLQVVASLLNLQADILPDDRIRQVFGAVRDRVCAMALVHEKLYQSDGLARVNFADYATSLLHTLWHAHQVGANVRLKLELAPVTMPIGMAVPCGLILNELACNALKHAFPDGRTGEVVVTLTHEANRGTACLRVRDNGIGLPADLDQRQACALGLRLIQMLTLQLNGVVVSHSDPGRGTEFQVTFAVKEACGE